MCENFHPVFTQDGSIGLFNNVVDDIYHSSSGAYREALQKFVYPSGVLNFVANHDQVSILDVCYGVGYNSKSAISKILEINPSIKIKIDCLEIDPDVLAFSILMKQSEFDDDLLYFLESQLLSNLKVEESLLNILNKQEITDFISKKTLLRLKSQYKNANLHNIYYRNISELNKKSKGGSLKSLNMAFTVHLGDARTAVKQLNTTYDYIFLDAFTPAKLPTLWSVDFMRELKRLLSVNGNITTYSASAAVRAGMLEAGLYVGKTESGTIAYNSESLLETKLTFKDIGLMASRAGIPYYDRYLNDSPFGILERRKKMVLDSDRISSSRFLKDFQNCKKEL